MTQTHHLIDTSLRGKGLRFHLAVDVVVPHDHFLVQNFPSVKYFKESEEILHEWQVNESPLLLLVQRGVDVDQLQDRSGCSS